MKNQLNVFLFCICIVVIVSPSCKQKKGGSGEAYTLKMRLNKGDKFSNNMDMSMKMGFAVMGQTMDMNMGVKGNTSFEVTNDSSDFKELVMTYNDMKMSMEMKGAQGMNKTIGDTSAGSKLEGKAVKLKLNDKNEIVDVKGMEDVMLNDSIDVATKEQMKKMFSKEQMNSMFGLMFQMYPGTPVQVGDDWEKENEVNIAGIAMKMLGKYKLTSVKDGVAYIDMKGKLKGKGKMSQGGMEMEMDMDGGQEGTINIGLTDGYIKDSQVTIDMKADMSTMGQKIPVTVKGYYLIKRNQY